MKKSPIIPLLLSVLTASVLFLFQCSKSGNGSSKEALYQTNSMELPVKENLETIKPVQKQKKNIGKNKIKEAPVKKNEKSPVKEKPGKDKTADLIPAVNNGSVSNLSKQGMNGSNQVIMKDGEYFIKFYQKNKTNIWIKKDLSNSSVESGEKQEGLVGEEGNVLYQKVTQ